MTLTIAGLVSGQGYLLEWWCNDAGLVLGGTTQTPTATAINSVNVIDNLANANGSLGQYAIGNFTADNSGLESITFTGAPVMNAFQLRTVAPEPSSSVMVLGSIVILAGFRRFRLFAKIGLHRDHKS